MPWVQLKKDNIYKQKRDSAVGANQEAVLWNRATMKRFLKTTYFLQGSNFPFRRILRM